MTRKSAARVQKVIKEQEAKEALKNNTCWDDLKEVHVSANLLMQKHLVISGMLRNKELCGFLPDVALVTNNAKILANDVKLLADELNSLYGLHGDKTGGTEDPDVILHTIGIYEQYQLFMTRHEAVLMPTIGIILEEFHKAEERLNVAFSTGLEQEEEMVINMSADDKAAARLSAGATSIEDAVFEEVK